MELRNLKTFLQIVECEGFTAAAECLGYTQSAVSTQIRQLETELGCRLFDRINHTVRLTEQGQLLLRHALEVEHSVQSLRDSFRSEEEPAGTVRIISSDSICEKMMLLNYAAFYRTYPGIKLVFQTASTSDMLRALSRHEADVAFTLDSHVCTQGYVIARESPVPLHFVASATHPLAGSSRLDIRRLLEYPFLLTEAGMSYRKVLDDRLAELQLSVDAVLEAGRTDILADCLPTGNGISFLPDFVTEPGVRAGRLARLDVEGFDLSIWKQLIYHRDKWISRTLDTFLTFVKEHEFEW